MVPLQMKFLADMQTAVVVANRFNDNLALRTNRCVYTTAQSYHQFSNRCLYLMRQEKKKEFPANRWKTIIMADKRFFTLRNQINTLNDLPLKS